MSAWEWDAITLDPAEKRPDGRNWARLILKRQEKGGRVPHIALDFAREALGLDAKPMREPGEEG